MVLNASAAIGKVLCCLPLAAWLGTILMACSTLESQPVAIRGDVALPAPSSLATMPLDDAIAGRRSRREFSPTPLTSAQLGQLLWAAQGTSDAQGHRTAPSAGALYPLELYIASKDGVFHYVSGEHKLEQLDLPDVRSDLAGAALDQDAINQAAAVVVVTGVIARTRSKYGDRAERYVAMEVGHAAQNLLLEATALSLVGVTIGAFDDDGIREVLHLPAGTFPYYLLCLGAPPG